MAIRAPDGANKFILISVIVKECYWAKPILCVIVKWLLKSTSLTSRELAMPKENNKQNIAKGTTDPGVDCFDQSFWFGRFGSVCLVS